MTAPPGQTEEIHCRRALVLAPHYDDEILGCGGLLARLVAGGCEVRVLFLSDGSGGVEEVEDRPAYGQRRRAEGEAVAAYMGFAGIEHLALPDGALEGALLRLEEAITAALEAHQPELLLVPSPLEATPDHRATFAALHKVLGRLRPEEPGGDTAAGPRVDRVLVYEINHPFYPELLVDVSDELETIRGAMELYPSQQGRHDYAAAAVGLRRYRTLTLDSSVSAAEGYVCLGVGDFATHSPSQLVRRLGGEPHLLQVFDGPPISVVVRTRNRPQLLAQALASLAESTYRKVEVVVVNDGGEPPAVAADFPLTVRRVELAENLGRAGAANAGVAAATGEYIAFLDDDDLVAPEHFATLARLVCAAGVRVAYTDAAVAIYELDGASGWRCAERRLPYSRSFDRDLLALDNYIPFNTLLIEADLLRAAGSPEGGPFDTALPFFEDWDLLLRLAQRVAFHHLPQVTCEYRHFRGGGDQIFGESPRERADFLEVKARVLAKHRQDLAPADLARAVDTMRKEAVQLTEAARSRKEELGQVRRRLTERDDSFFRLNGRLAALEGDHERLQQAFEETRAALKAKADEEEALRRVVADQEDHLGRTYAEIGKLNAVAQDHSEHLGRTYAEIERLNGLIEAMQGTRAWRIHQWIQRRRG